MVRAKFRVHSKKEMVHSKDVVAYEVMMMPVYDADPQSENGQFYAATPSGSIMLSVINAAAGEQFEVGKEYYVAFTPAE